MSTKIQINSLEALERLIGNDNELEIQVRNSVVQEFSRKYLKNLAEEEFLKKEAIAIREWSTNQFFTKTRENYKDIYQFKPEVLEKIKSDISYSINIQFAEIISNLIKKEDIANKLEAKLNEASDFIVNELTNPIIEQKLNRMVNEKLKEKFL